MVIRLLYHAVLDKSPLMPSLSPEPIELRDCQPSAVDNSAKEVCSQGLSQFALLIGEKEQEMCSITPAKTDHADLLTSTERCRAGIQLIF